MKNKKPLQSNGFLFCKLLVCVLKTASELVNASAGVNELLLAGEEGMTLGADVNTDLSALRRTGHKGFSASADNLGFNIIGMDCLFHYSTKYITRKNDSQDFACLTVFTGCTSSFRTVILKILIIISQI